MGDVVSVEVDGELGEPEFDGGPRRGRWGMPVAAALVAAMVVALAWTALSGPSDRDTTAAPIDPATTTTVLVVTTTATTSAPTTTARPVADDPVAGARQALADWGRFAATGDLRFLDTTFTPDGPQRTQLAAEAGSVAAAGPAPRYTLTLENPVVEADAATATVTGDVTWSRTGESDQRYRWALDLRRAATGTWQLHNVVTVSAADQ